MNTHSGNASYKNTILETITSLKSALRPESKVYYISDSSFYTDNNIKKTGKSFWISRVPATISEAKELLTVNLNLKTLKSDEIPILSNLCGIWRSQTKVGFVAFS